MTPVEPEQRERELADLPSAATTRRGRLRPIDADSAPALVAQRLDLATWLLDGPGRRVVLPIVDIVAVWLAVLLTLNWPGNPELVSSQQAPILWSPLIVALILATRGGYRRSARRSMLDDVGIVLTSTAMATLGVVALEVYASRASVTLGVLTHLWLITAAALVLARACVALLVRQLRRRGLMRGRATLIVGAGAVGTKIARRLQDRPEYGLRPVGFLDAHPGRQWEDERTVPVLGGPDDLDWIAPATGAATIVLAFSTDSDESLARFVRRCDVLGLDILLVPRLFESLNDRTTYEPLGGLPMMGLEVTDPKGWQFTLKHACDRVIAAVGLTLLAPLLGAVALAVRVSSPGPVLFRQRRIGRDGRAFDLLKFRSMRMGPVDVAFDPSAGSAPGGVEGLDRRTRVGAFLRRYSLDELPQLINVVRGDMSLVGPRPERPEYVRRFEDDVARYGDRHRVKSGITGWAQVHGLRGQTSLEDRVEWDNSYIEHWSLALDLKIIALTLPAVLRRAE